MMIKSITRISDESLKSALSTGKSWNERWNNLFSGTGNNTSYYYIGGSPYSKYAIWGTNGNEIGDGGDNTTEGVRPVISLKSGILTTSGDGSSLANAFVLSVD